MNELVGYMPFVWLGFAVFMAVCEAATTQLVSIWFVIGALCAAVATVFTPSLLIQSLIFLAVSLIALIITRPFVKRFKEKHQKVNTNSDRVIGQIGVVLSAIEDAQSVGQVKVLGETWSARSDFAPIQANTKIKVLSIEGVKLLVEPAE